MTREEWAVLVKAMKAVYTSPSFLPDQYAFDTWYGLLKDLDYKLLSFGLKKYMQTEWKEPSIAALRQCAQNIAPQKEELNETEAWEKVCKAIQNSTYNAEAEFDKLPKIIQKAVSSPAQLREWAVSENVDGTWWSVVQSNFQRTYRAEVQREQERRKLSPDLLKIIDTARLKSTEIIGLKRRQCSKCDYYSKSENAWSTNATCDYILIEEHSRGCDPRDCVKNGIFKKKARGKSRVKRVIL